MYMYILPIYLSNDKKWLGMKNCFAGYLNHQNSVGHVKGTEKM
jgi:hypothetical protein